MIAQTYLDTPLTIESCQRILYEAMRNVLYADPVSSHPPEGLDWSCIRERARAYGPEVYIIHPCDVEQLFQGVTLGTYKFIDELFCSRVGRNISTVLKIVNEKLKSEGKQSVGEIACWAICMYLLKKRREALDVTIRYLNVDWFIVSFDIKLEIIAQNNRNFFPSVVGVIEMEEKRIISYRICQKQDIGSQIPLAFYQAVVSKRIPSRAGVAGLVWNLPKVVYVQSQFSLPMIKNLEAMGFSTQVSSSIPEIVEHLQGDWIKDLVGRQVHEERFSLIFDKYLYRVYGYGPSLEEKNSGYLYADRTGYNRDPLWQFPALRLLFEPEPSTVSGEGYIRIGSFLYGNELLRFWKNQTVEAIVSPSDNSSAWVYTQDGDVICQAKAV